MRWEVRLFFLDRGGNRRSVSTWVVGLDSIAALVAFANAFGGALQALSNAHLVDATLTTKRQVSVSTTAQLGSNTGRKLLVIGTDGVNYGSILVPSPADLPFADADPTGGYRIPKSYYPPDHPIAVGIAALANTVTPTGAPFPVSDWVIALVTP